MYGLHFREELDEPVARELDALIAKFKAFLLLEHNEDGSHNFETSVTLETIRQIIDQYQAEGQFWKTGPWKIDDPFAARPHVAGLRPPNPAAGTYDNYTPTGVDTSVVIEIEPDGDITLTGLKALDGANQKRLLMLRNRDSSATITLQHEGTGSLEKYRFDLPEDLDVQLDPHQNVWLYYDPGRERWTAAITGQASGAILSPGVESASFPSATSEVKVATKTITNAMLEAGGPVTIVTGVGGSLIVPVRAMTFLSRSAAGKGSNTTFTYHYVGASGGDDQIPLTQQSFNLSTGDVSPLTGTGLSTPSGFDPTATTTGGRDYRGDGIEVEFTAVTPGTGTASVYVVVWYMEAVF